MNKPSRNINIPYGRQDINQHDIDSVVEVLKSDFLTQGPVVPQFEEKVKTYCGAKYATAVNSATSALHIACMSLNVTRGDIVWTSPNTFVASSNCALYCGAEVDFVDIDPRTYNISVDNLKNKLKEAKLINKLPKVLIAVHQSGQSCDMESIHNLSKEYNFHIIEDALHSIGASYKDQKTGSCQFSDITVFSFHPVKIITSGEGGMSLTNNIDLDNKMKLHRSHGITSLKEDMFIRPLDELWNYQQVTLGYNYRMTDIHAALGMSQLDRLDEFVASRHKIANRYEESLKEIPLITPFQIKDSFSSYHLYLVRLKIDLMKKSQLQVYSELRSKGVLVNLHYIPVYLQPFYQNLGFKRGYCPNSEDYFKSILSIPMYASLDTVTQDRVIEIMKETIK